MTHAIGIMQGRLVPRVGDRIQAFPRDCWEDEFAIAAKLGFESIELTIETASWDIHPIRSDEGRVRLERLSRSHGIALAGLCCDTIMERPFAGADPAERGEAKEMLLDLMVNGAKAGLPMIDLPVVGTATLRPTAARDRFAEVMDWALPRAEELAIDILIESDLPPDELEALLRRIDHHRLGINYDTGDRTWFGHDPREELPRLLPFVRNIHIKDCTREDYSVALGTGETDFETIFDLLAQHEYRGNFIIQAARGDDDVGAARDYLDIVRGFVERHFQEAAA